MTPLRFQTGALVLASALVSSLAAAFVPPVAPMVHEIFDGRKAPKRAAELVLHHRVEVKPGEVVEIEERILSERGRTRLRWRVGSQVVTGIHDKEGYAIDGGGRIESKSRLFLKYLLNLSGEDFLATAQDEGFVRRDQLQQFNNTYSPTGDPNLWDVRAGYIRHPDIFVHRVRQGIAYAVVGKEDGESKRAIYFDQELRGIRRIEWRDGDKNAMWDFDGFYEPGKDGKFPRHLYFTWNGEEKIRSELLAVRNASDRQVAEFGAANRSSLGGSFETALQLLLSYR